MKGEQGKVGCGCLFFSFLALLVALFLFLHPLTLRIVGKQLIYADKVHYSDVIFVPKFSEDTEGETYVAAFEELKKGSAKSIWIEDYEILRTSVVSILKKLAKERGIKEDLIKGVNLNGNEAEKRKTLAELLKKERAKKTIVMVPEYASRRFHILYRSSENGEQVFFVVPVKVRYFNSEKWWKESVSRDVVIKEYAAILSIFLDNFKYKKVISFRK